jgi:hypothetical protein
MHEGSARDRGETPFPYKIKELNLCFDESASDAPKADIKGRLKRLRLDSTNPFATPMTSAIGSASSSSASPSTCPCASGAKPCGASSNRPRLSGIAPTTRRRGSPPGPGKRSAKPATPNRSYSTASSGPLRRLGMWTVPGEELDCLVPLSLGREEGSVTAAGDRHVGAKQRHGASGTGANPGQDSTTLHGGPRHTVSSSPWPMYGGLFIG